MIALGERVDAAITWPGRSASSFSGVSAGRGQRLMTSTRTRPTGDTPDQNGQSTTGQAHLRLGVRSEVARVVLGPMQIDGCGHVAPLPKVHCLAG